MKWRFRCRIHLRFNSTKQFYTNFDKRFQLFPSGLYYASSYGYIYFMFLCGDKLITIIYEKVGLYVKLCFLSEIFKRFF
ncbi:hypothetical protein RvY_02377 [Ramazzottius varieornatus]|uniref:Uncharacterized protein n=1 Tax=Ramazzottius varieornatus TaxID=947166 RepID=A0A1D1UUM7_RAMVA|nr:hypothetical protein RvY_02377 [Ramazzottius varieornatus]